MTIETLGVDIAKNVFQLHGVNRNGHVVLKRRVMRDQLLSTLTQIERCTVVIEACTGAFYWARKFEAFGHEVKIISPQYVKPFVRRQKNDGNDAEAICTAARQPHIPFVPKKTIEQQDIQALHRARQRMGSCQSDPRPPSRSRFRHRKEHHPCPSGDSGDPF
jgi:transposase